MTENSSSSGSSSSIFNNQPEKEGTRPSNSLEKGFPTKSNSVKNKEISFTELNLEDSNDRLL